MNWAALLLAVGGLMALIGGLVARWVDKRR